MKRFISVLTLSLICLIAAVGVQAEDMFKELKAHPDVESIHVSRFMMSVARSAIRMSGDKDSKAAIQFLKGIKSMDIISCEKPSAVKAVQALAKKAIAGGKYELALEDKDKDETAYIWCLPDKATDSDKLRDVIIEVIEPKEYSLIKINGTIDPAKFTSEAFK